MDVQAVESCVTARACYVLQPYTCIPTVLTLPLATAVLCTYTVYTAVQELQLYFEVCT